MSEDEKAACRLTYREGMRIAELAQGPFMKAKNAMFWMLAIGMMAMFGMFVIGNAFPPEVSTEAIEAGFTAAQWDYLRESVNVAISTGAMIGFLFSFLTIEIVLIVLQSSIVKDWLKAANEEEKE